MSAVWSSVERVLLYYDTEKTPMFVYFVYYWHSLVNGMLCAGLVLMAYPLLDIPQRNWFVGNLKTLSTAAPTGTIILYGEMEGHRTKEPSRETGRPLRSSERPVRSSGPPTLLYGWFYPRGYSCRVGILTDHSRTSSAIVKNDWSYTFIYPYAFTAWCWTKHKDNCLSYCSRHSSGWTEKYHENIIQVSRCHAEVQTRYFPNSGHYVTVGAHFGYVESAAVILERYIIEIFMDNSISSHPHHNFFVERKFLYFWKL
jgi:hypothetical protein